MHDIHGVDLLERPALALHYEEIDHQASEYVAAGEDVAVAEVDVADDEGCEEGEHEVPEPLRCCQPSQPRCVPLMNDGKGTHQLLAVLSAIALARYLLGYSSPQIVHIMGPCDSQYSLRAPVSLRNTHPGRSKAEDEERCKADHSHTSFGCIGWGLSVESKMANRSEDQEADEHPHGSSLLSVVSG